MPYTYDDYLQGIETAQGPQDQGTRQIGGSGYSPTGTPQGGYKYNSNMDTGDFVWANVKQDFSGPQGLFSVHSPVSAITRAFKGRAAFKEKRGAERARRREFKRNMTSAKERAGTRWLGTIDPTSQAYKAAEARLNRGAPMSDEELNASIRQEQMGKQRGRYEKEVEAYFSDPARAGWQQGIVQNRLQNDLANVKEAYGNELTATGQRTAGRGLKGSSVDVETRGEVARTRDTRAIDAASNADRARADFRRGDQQSRAHLLGLINSGDIGNADALRSALESVHSQTTAEGARYASGDRSRQINQFTDQMQGQAWGGGLQAIADSIDQRPNTYGYGWSGISQGGW